MKHTERTILKALRTFCDNHKYVIANAFIFNWESDLFSVTKTGTVYEFEVKISKADFKKDFEKEKHTIFKNRNNDIFYTSDKKEKSGFTCINGNDFIGCNNVNENAASKGDYGKFYHYCELNWVDMKRHLIPQRFYYVCPAGLISSYDVPEYAGLIHVDGYTCNVVTSSFVAQKRYLRKIKINTSRKVLVFIRGNEKAYAV